jgi:hypothetical protein
MRGRHTREYRADTARVHPSVGTTYPEPMNRVGPWMAIVSVIAAIAVVAAVVARAIPPTIPEDAASTVVARTVLTGEIAPDASDGVDPETIPRSPVGQECLDVIERPAGPLSLCWEAYRDPFDGDPLQDYYRMRAYGTFGGDTGTGVRWVVVRAQLVGEPSNNVFEGWPEGPYEGPCRDVPVELHWGGPGTSDTICGLTEGRTDQVAWSHRVTWTCVDCLIPDHANRAISLHEFLAVPAGTVPTWEIFADLGS